VSWILAQLEASIIITFTLDTWADCQLALYPSLKNVESLHSEPYHQDKKLIIAISLSGNLCRPYRSIFVKKWKRIDTIFFIRESMSVLIFTLEYLLPSIEHVKPWISDQFDLVVRPLSLCLTRLSKLFFSHILLLTGPDDVLLFLARPLPLLLSLQFSTIYYHHLSLIGHQAPLSQSQQDDSYAPTLPSFKKKTALSPNFDRRQGTKWVTGCQSCHTSSQVTCPFSSVKIEQSPSMEEHAKSTKIAGLTKSSALRDFRLWGLSWNTAPTSGSYPDDMQDNK